MKQELIKTEGGLNLISPDTGLTAQQEKCAILMASGITISEVSKQMKVGRATLYRWLGLTAFQCYLNLMKQDAKNYLEGSLLGMQTKAIETIRASLDSETEATRVKSAMWVMDKVGQMEVGATDVRQVMLEESKLIPKHQNWRWQEDYLKKLKDAGLAD